MNNNYNKLGFIGFKKFYSSKYISDEINDFLKDFNREFLTKTLTNILYDSEQNHDYFFEDNEFEYDVFYDCEKSLVTFNKKDKYCKSLSCEMCINFSYLLFRSKLISNIDFLHKDSDIIHTLFVPFLSITRNIEDCENEVFFSQSGSKIILQGFKMMRQENTKATLNSYNDKIKINKENVVLGKIDKCIDESKKDCNFAIINSKDYEIGYYDDNIEKRENKRILKIKNKETQIFENYLWEKSSTKMLDNRDGDIVSYDLDGDFKFTYEYADETKNNYNFYYLKKYENKLDYEFDFKKIDSNKIYKV